MPPSGPRLERVLALAIAALLSAQLLVVAERSSHEHQDAPLGTVAPQVQVPVESGAAPRAATEPRPARTPTRGGTPAATPSSPDPADPEDDSGDTRQAAGASSTRAASRTTDVEAAGGSAAHMAAGTTDPARARFERRFPAHAAAAAKAGDPATTRWAVLIGINKHDGRVRDNIGSRQDAEDLQRLLLELGWRPDHVLLLTDRAATRENIEQALLWLGRKSDDRSVSVVHYSGHSKKWRGDIDGDGEDLDEGLWPYDHRFITDRRFVTLLDGVDGRMWVNLAACEAEGLADPGLARPGRLITMSSREDEKSYEDPSVGNSVWGWYLIDEGLSTRYADADDDGDVTVQEAFEFAAPRASQRTSRQRHGPQHPVMDDRIGTAFSLRLPRPTGEEPPADDEEERRCTLGICFGDDDRSRRQR